MAVEKNIVMKEFNGTDYDTLYPKTIGTQVDGVFTSEQTLTSDTLAKYQLSASAVPDDVFSWLGKYAQYWWRRRTSYEQMVYRDITVDESNFSTYFTMWGVKSSVSYTVRYSDEINFYSSGEPYLVNEQTVSFSYDNPDASSVLVGKYIYPQQAGTTDTNNVYYIKPNQTIVKHPRPYNNKYYTYFVNIAIPIQVATVYTDWEYVQSNNRNAYPDGESFGYVVDLSHTFNDVYITNAYETRTIYYSSDIGFDSEGTPYLVGETSLSINYNSGTDIFNLLKGKYIRNIWFSNATSADIYFIPAEKTVRPDNGYVVANMATKVGSKFVPLPPEDGYQYEYLGVPFDNLPTASTVEIGSYIGTGTYGEANPNSLTFNCIPKIVYITNGGNSGMFLINDGNTVSYVGTGTHTIGYMVHCTFDGKSISWYTNDTDNAAYGPQSQGNASKNTYRYIVFG